MRGRYDVGCNPTRSDTRLGLLSLPTSVDNQLRGTAGSPLELSPRNLSSVSLWLPHTSYVVVGCGCSASTSPRPEFLPVATSVLPASLEASSFSLCSGLLRGSR